VSGVDADRAGRYSLHVPTHRTLAGDELDYPEPDDELASFLDRVREAASDPDVAIAAMVELVYGADNPLLDPSSPSPIALPQRGTATAETWADPAWHVMLDLLEAKRVAVAEITPSLLLEEAGELLALTPDAVRKAVLAETLDGEKYGNRWHVTPASVATYRDRVLRRGRWPATPLRFRCGNASGYGMDVKTAVKPRFVRRVRKGVTEFELDDFERVLVRLRRQRDDGTKATRLLVLEADPSVEPFRFRWPTTGAAPGFFIEGRYRDVQKVNNSTKALAAWRKLEPA